MVPQVVLTTEAFAADVARVRPLVRVRAFVDKQVVRLGKMAATEPTDELLSSSVKEAANIALRQFLASHRDVIYQCITFALHKYC